MLLAVDERIYVISGQLESVAVGNRIGGTCFDAIAAKNAAGIIDVVNLGVALSGRDTAFLGIFRSLNVNAIRWAGRSAQKTPHAFLEIILIAM